MAQVGVPLNRTELVPIDRGEVARRLQQQLAGNTGNYFDGFTIQSDGQTYLTLTRKYIPQWALIGGVIGILFFLVGLLLWMVRTTEVLQINLKDVAGGTEVQIHGIASPEQAQAIQRSLNALMS